MSKKHGHKAHDDEQERRDGPRHDRHRDRAEAAKRKQKTRDHIDRWESLPRNLPWDE